jgi:hypothetical protein
MAQWWVGGVLQPLAPAPQPSAPDRCVLYIDTANMSPPLAGDAVMTATLGAFPALADTVALRTYAGEAWADASGRIALELVRNDSITWPAGSHYVVDCPALGVSGFNVTLASDTVDLAAELAA